jgi:hypothetical protein
MFEEFCAVLVRYRDGLCVPFATCMALHALFGEASWPPPPSPSPANDLSHVASSVAPGSECVVVGKRGVAVGTHGVPLLPIAHA